MEVQQETPGHDQLDFVCGRFVNPDEAKMHLSSPIALCVPAKASASPAVPNALVSRSRGSLWRTKRRYVHLRASQRERLNALEA